MRDVLLDASALLALIHKESGQDRVAAAIATAAISAVNLSEVIGKLAGPSRCVLRRTFNRKFGVSSICGIARVSYRYRTAVLDACQPFNSQRAAEILYTVIKWFIFGVVVTAIPILYSVLNLFIFKQNPVDLARVIGNGEMFIIAAALCAGGLGELLGTNETYRTWKLVTGGLCVVMLLLATLSFAGLAEATAYDRTAVMRSSLWIYAVSVFSAGGSVALAQT